MRIHSRVASVEVVLDVAHVDGVCHAGNLVDVSQVVEEIGVVMNGLLVTLEVHIKHLHESRNRECTVHQAII